MVRLCSAACLVWITAQKQQNRTTQFGGIFFEIVEEIDAKLLRTDVTLPARDGFTRVGPDQHTRIEQILNHFLSIGRIERTDHPKANAHG